MSNDLKDKIESAIELLQPLAEQANMPSHYWIHGGDEGVDYCESCAEKEIEKLQTLKPGDYIAVEGDGPSDSPAQCDSCCKCLSYSLTDYGASNELSHFLADESALSGPLYPETAYEVVAVLEVLRHADGSDLEGASKLAESAAALMPAVAPRSAA